MSNKLITLSGLGANAAALHQLCDALARENLTLRRAIASRARDENGEALDLDHAPIDEVVCTLEHERQLHDGHYEHQRHRAMLSLLVHQAGGEITMTLRSIENMPEGHLLQAYDAERNVFVLRYAPTLQDAPKAT